MNYSIDRGNLHVIDYYLFMAVGLHKPQFLAKRYPLRKPSESDFDIDTERREGWAYD